MSEKPVLAVIGGSGLYAMPDLQEVQHLEISTPFGKPSAPIMSGKLDGKPVVFLARHGIGHVLTPSEVPYQANIYALKTLGVERVVSISACGSLREDYAPGEIVVPDQLFDFTRDRQRSFFGEGLVAHVGVADPFCGDLSGSLMKALNLAGAVAHQGGTLITIEGPRFSTRGESSVYRSWGLSLIGMTACPEAFLAREAEMCYATMAHVTDYDVWHVSAEPVTVDMVIRTLNHNTALAQQAVRQLLKIVSGQERGCECGSALSTAIISHRDYIHPEAKQKLGLLVDKYLK